jgi:addiction module RelB/DinJ family antitoxin
VGRREPVHVKLSRCCRTRKSAVESIQYAELASVEKFDILGRMSRIVRSAMLQMRVAPEIKLATEHVLRRIGLNLTEATELFLRRMIIEQRLPFDVVAFDNATYTQLVLDWEDETRTITMKRDRRVGKASRMQNRIKRE